jgi:aldehyde:ferredoxin oxidoreductase
MDIDEAELWKIARRNMTLVRAINVTRGIRRKDDRPPDDHWKHRFPEIEAKLLDEYYKLKGWNGDGIPTKQTLEELGLDYVTTSLEQRGILKNNENISTK